MLSEISRSQKDKFCAIPLIGGISSHQIHGDRKQNRVTRGWGGEFVAGWR